MVETLLVTLKKQSYKTDTGTEIQHDSTAFGDIIDADVGYAVTTDDVPLEQVHYDELTSEMGANSFFAEMASPFHERFCVTNPEEFTDNVRLRSGETVSVGDYEVVLISHFWLYHHYLDHLQSKHPNVKFVGILDEAVQDVVSSSSDLKMRHYDTMSKLDGYISTNEQYRDWISPVVDNAIHLPLPIPKGQFDGYSRVEDENKSDSICVGVGTFNLEHANFYTNLLVLQRLRRDGIDLGGDIIGIRDRQEPSVDSYRENLDFLDVHGFYREGLYDYFAELPFAVLMTTRATTGRVACELAGLGVPCIGNVNNDMQARCWPELSVDPYDTAEAVSLAKRLHEDEAFYERNVQRAQRKVAELQNHERFSEKLRGYVERIAES